MQSKYNNIGQKGEDWKEKDPKNVAADMLKTITKISQLIIKILKPLNVAALDISS